MPVEEEVTDRSERYSVSQEEFDTPEVQEAPQSEDPGVDDPVAPEPYESDDGPDAALQPEVIELPPKDTDIGNMMWHDFPMGDLMNDFVNEAAEITADKMAQMSAMMELQFDDKLNEHIGLMDRRGAF